MTCTATHTVTQADIDAGHYANTACADDGAGGAAQQCASKDAPAVQTPSIAIEKSPSSQTVAVGGTAKFRITVTNTGNTVLMNVTVTDPKTSGCNRTSAQIPALASIAPGASVTYTCSRKNMRAGYTNTATATGTSPSGSNVSATDRAPVKVKAVKAKKVVKKKPRSSFTRRNQSRSARPAGA